MPSSRSPFSPVLSASPSLYMWTSRSVFVCICFPRTNCARPTFLVGRHIPSSSICELMLIRSAYLFSLRLPLPDYYTHSIHEHADTGVIQWGMYGVLAKKLLYTALYMSSYYNMCLHTGMGVIQWGMECQLKRNAQHRTAETCQTAEILHKTSGIFRTAENCRIATASNETIIRCICTSGESQPSIRCC